MLYDKKPRLQSALSTTHHTLYMSISSPQSSRALNGAAFQDWRIHLGLALPSCRCAFFFFFTNGQQVQVNHGTQRRVSEAALLAGIDAAIRASMCSMVDENIINCIEQKRLLLNHVFYFFLAHPCFFGISATAH